VTAPPFGGPMLPSPAEWDQFRREFEQLPAKIRRTIDGLVRTAESAFTGLWRAAWPFIEPILETLVKLTDEILEKLGEVADGIYFPILAIVAAIDWDEKIKNPVNTVNGDVSDAHLHVTDYWQGQAAQSYLNAVTAQTAAMSEVSSIIDNLLTHLYILAAAIVAFYIALVTVLVQWIGVMIAGTAADATGAGAVVGVPAQAADTGVSAAAVIGLITATVAIVTDEAHAFTTINGAIKSNAHFPNGHWPQAVTGILREASEKGSNTMEWHIKY
jgi:hypothetical protein